MLFNNPAEAQVWIHSAGLEVTDLKTTDNPTVTTTNNKHASKDTSVGQSANAGGNDISGDCNLHADQLQVYNHDMNTKDEARKKTHDNISQTIGKTHVDISQTIDTEVGNVLKGKPVRSVRKVSTCGVLSSIFG